MTPLNLLDPFHASYASEIIQRIRRDLLLLGVIGILGALLSSGAGFLAISWTYRSLQAANTATGALRIQADTDMMHDAIRGDVFAIAAGSQSTRARTDFDRHAANLERNLSELQKASLPDSLKQIVEQEASKLRAYVTTARRLLEQLGAITSADTMAFTSQWRDLEPR